MTRETTPFEAQAADLSVNFRNDEHVLKYIARGLLDEEILELILFGGRPVTDPPPPLITRRFWRLRIAAHRRALNPPGRPMPIVTPEQASEAYARLGTERKAADELRISKTQLRRLLGKD